MIKDRRKLFGSYEESKVIKGETIDFAKGSVVELMNHWNAYLRMAMMKFRMDEISAEALLAEIIYEMAKEPDIYYVTDGETNPDSIMEVPDVNPTFYVRKEQKTDYKATPVKEYNDVSNYDDEASDFDILEELTDKLGIFDDTDPLDSEGADIDEDNSQDKEEKDASGLNPFYCKAIKSKMEYLYQVGLSNNTLSFRPNIVELPIEQKVSVNNSEVTYDISDVNQLLKGDGLEDVGIELEAEVRYMSAFRNLEGNMDILKALLVLMYLEDKMSDMVNVGIDNKKILKLLLGCTDDGIDIMQHQLHYNSDVSSLWKYLHSAHNGIACLKKYVYGSDYIETFIQKLIP